MRYGSVCSGVEAATLAWHQMGWKCVFVSEVEPFPCAVLQERFDATAPINPLDPAESSSEDDRKMRESWIKQNEYLKKEGVLPNEGDFTKIGKKYAGQIDLLVGGTPCQDLSVAGKRAGFDGERSSLALDFVRLAYESKCKWFVWENVPGVFSSNEGRDFATLLSLFTGCEVDVPKKGWGTAGFVCNARSDRYGVAWRTLDGQFTRASGFPFAVPQRRRRVFLVGYFGDWTRAAEVLLEPGRVCWNTPARFKARERIAEIAGTNSAMADGALRCNNGDSTDRHWDNSGVNPTLNQCSAGSATIGQSNQELFGQNFNGLATSIGESGKGFYNESKVAQTLEAHEDQHRRNIIFWNGNDCAEALTCTSDRQLMPDKSRLQCVIERNEVAYNGAGDESGAVTPTLQANLGKLFSNQTPIVLNDQGGSVMVGINCGMSTGRNGVVDTVTNQPAVAIAENIIGRADHNGGNGVGAQEEIAYTQNASGVMGVCTSTVRRLLPIECERLMGFPDDHTKIPWKGKSAEDCPDSPRYKACGNSMCVNVMRWIGEQIQRVEDKYNG